MRAVLAVTILTFLKALRATLRVRHSHAEHLASQPQAILSFWHEHLSMMLFSRFRHPIMVISSRSRDGELSAQVFQRVGVLCARGSTTRGGSSALRTLIRAARDGASIVFTPDGPKGPRRIAKSGVVFAAQATGLPVVPIAFHASRAKRLASWDRMVVPMPFARLLFVYGEPLRIPRDGDVDEWTARVESTMNELTARAADQFEKLWSEAGA